jgi:dolichol-phosphate mannosyltransferase
MPDEPIPHPPAEPGQPAGSARPSEPAAGEARPPAPPPERETLLWISTDADDDPDARNPTAPVPPVTPPPPPSPEPLSLDDPSMLSLGPSVVRPEPPPAEARPPPRRNGRRPGLETLPPDAPAPDPVKTDLISLVIPVLNEQDSLRPLHAEIAEVASRLAPRCEVIFIDDGSTDESWSVIRHLAAKDPRVKGVRFRRNFGKAAALSAGFAAARGGVVITLDADLQDDPKEIPQMLAALDGGLDVVSGWKKVRSDPWHKVFPSRVFNALVRLVTGVHLHDHNCGMKAYRAEVLREVHLYGEMHRFVPVLAAGRGFRVGELVVNHRPRRFGVSKYGWRRFVKGLLDLLTVRFLTGFGRRPQHLLGTLGLVNWGLGLLGLGVLVLNALVRWIWPDVGLGVSAQTILAMLSLGAFLFGTQLLTSGLLSELFIARGLVETEQYSVAERTEPIEL